MRTKHHACLLDGFSGGFFGALVQDFLVVLIRHANAQTEAMAVIGLTDRLEEAALANPARTKRRQSGLVSIGRTLTA
jgi:hypothetical protein